MSSPTSTRSVFAKKFLSFLLFLDIRRPYKCKVVNVYENIMFKLVVFMSDFK